MAERKDDLAYLQAKMEQAKVNTISMIDLAIANNIIPIIGTLIPRTTAKGIYRQGLWDYNDWIIDYCNGRVGVYYVDFYNAGKKNIPETPLEEPSVPGNLNPLYDGDSVFDAYGNLIRRGQGVHPSVVGYKLMAEAFPLAIFKSLSAGVKMYLDEACTIEEDSETLADLSVIYSMEFKNVNRGRTKQTIRYLKNVGSYPVVFSINPTKEDGLDIKFSKVGQGWGEQINGQLYPNGVMQINMEVIIPKFGVVPKVQLNLAVRTMRSTD